MENAPSNSTSPHAGTFPLPLRRQRIVFLPTRFGMVFLVSLAGMLLGAANHNNNLAFLMTFLLAGVGIVGLVVGHRNLAGLEVLAIAGEPVFAGETAVFTVTVRNVSGRGRALEAGVRVHDPSRFSLAEGETDGVDVFVPTERRGFVSPAPMRISTRYPLGLFRARTTVFADAPLPVFPRPDPAPLPMPAEAGGDGGTAPTPAAGAEDFEGLRPFRPGDPTRRIFWKSVSKERGLLVKHFTGSGGDIISLDWDRIPASEGEKKLSVLCRMVLRADQSGAAYRLRLPGVSLPAGNGPAHRIRCLTALAACNLPEGGP